MTYFLLLAPVTLGIGSAALWYWRRSLVQCVDDAGLTLQSGQRVPWAEVVSFHTRKSHIDGDGERRVQRLDIQLENGRALIFPPWLHNGEEMIEAVKSGAREALPPDARMRVQYVQRR